MKRRYIISIIIVLVFGLIMFIAFCVDPIRKESYEATIVVGENTTWNYSQKRWKKVSNETDFQTLNWKKYQIFDNDEDKGEYYLVHSDKWYGFDNKRNAVNLSDMLFAYRSNYNMGLDTFVEEDASSDEFIEKVLLDNDLSAESEFTKSTKISIDYDSDGIVEDFYTITNAFINSTPDKVFTIVFMVKEGEISYLYNETRAYKVYAGCFPEVIAFMDVNDDNKDEIIISCFQYSNLGRIDMLYEFQDNKFKILISNQ